MGSVVRCVRFGAWSLFALSLSSAMGAQVRVPSDLASASSSTSPPAGHQEVPDQPPGEPAPRNPTTASSTRSAFAKGPYVSVQVNVDENGANIVGDAANEPSMAVDPTNPNRIVIGWRQFDTISSNFRQGGWGYSHDAGATWTFPGVLEPGIFRSDPVLAADSSGVFYYYSLTSDSNLSFFCCDLFLSTDGGVTWDDGVFAFGGDKAWAAIDRSGKTPTGHFYAYWSRSFSCTSGQFIRSTDGGATFSSPVNLPGNPFWGTVDVGPEGELYILGSGLLLVRSTNANNPDEIPVFDLVTTTNLGGSTTVFGQLPNPGGLAGQAWIGTDHSDGPRRGNVYAMATVRPDIGKDPLEVMFVRSVDGGVSWSQPVRVNDDPPVGEIEDPPDPSAWQWFATMSVAPNGRIDAVWNDTRNTASVRRSELHYSFSTDEGKSWSTNVAVSPVFDSYLGWPQQNKLGDYYQTISDNHGVHVAYAATFNGEQDVYYLRIDPFIDCNGNGISDTLDISTGEMPDCNTNNIPDGCEGDFDRDGLIDGCDPDSDDDGFANEVDVCDYTPLGSRIEPDGGSLIDLDDDCDVDLNEYQIFYPCLSDGGPDVDQPFGVCPALFDSSADSDVDLNDTAVFFNEFNVRD